MAVYAASGVGFAGANLILARVLPTEQYALFTLVIALGNLGYALAPAGLDGLVNRHHLEAGPQPADRLARGLDAHRLRARVGRPDQLRACQPALAAMLFVSARAGGG